MSGRTTYLDTSAFLKLLVSEEESPALAESLTQWSRFASAALLCTETFRALHRLGNRELIGPGRRLMGTLYPIHPDQPLLDRAAVLPPSPLRSLDAVHLAAALSLGTDLAAVVTYDQRLAEAACAQGLPILTPR